MKKETQIKSEKVKSILKIENLTKEFDGLKAVSNLSISLEPGTITSLIGPNGAGKTTVFNMITGLIRPDKGRIIFKGRDITQWDTHKIAKIGITRTFQNIRLFAQMTVRDNILLAKQSREAESLATAVFSHRVFKKEEADHEASITAAFLDSPLEGKGAALAEELSHGQRKLLELERAISTDYDLLLLDEPTAGVFPEVRKEILQTIRQLKESGKTVLFIEHDMSVVMGISDKVIVMNYGEKIAEGKPDEIVKNREVIKAYLGNDTDKGD